MSRKLFLAATLLLAGATGAGAQTLPQDPALQRQQQDLQTQQQLLQTQQNNTQMQLQLQQNQLRQQQLFNSAPPPAYLQPVAPYGPPPPAGR